MLPFSIISNLNINPQPEIQIFSGGGSYFMLKNDKMYAIGNNSSGQFGISTPSSSRNWMYIRDNVKSIYPTNTATYIITYDNKIYFTGNTIYFTGTTGNAQTSFIECTNTLFSGIDVSTIIDIRYTDIDACFLLSDGRVYTIGFSNKPIALLFSNCKQMSSDQDKFIFIDNKNDQYYSGFGRLGSTGISVSSTESTWTPVFKVNLGNGFLVSQYIGWQFYCTDNNTLYSRGYNAGILGNGNTTNQSVFVQKVFSNVKLCFNQNRPTFSTIISDNKIYSTGSNTVGQLGIGTKVNVTNYTEAINLPFNVSDITSIATTSAGIMVIANGKLYVTGTLPYIFGSVNDNTYTALTFEQAPS